MKYKQIIKQLKDFKSTIRNRTNYDNYHELYNLCCDLEEGTNLYLTDKINDKDFVCDDMEDYLIKQNSDSIERLRYFIGDTYHDWIYRLDGYGNLENVDNDDFEYLCDELIDMVNDYFKEDKKDIEM